MFTNTGGSEIPYFRKFKTFSKPLRPLYHKKALAMRIPNLLWSLSVEHPLGSDGTNKNGVDRHFLRSRKRVCPREMSLTLSKKCPKKCQFHIVFIYKC